MALWPIFDKKIPITQKFGNKLIINWKDFYWQRGYKGHMWVDFWCPVGTRLYASVPWEVTVKNDWNNGYGLSVAIVKQRPDGSTWIIYAHLSETALKTWMVVKEWDFIGLAGNTGASTWPHLHFWIRLRDKKGNILNVDNGYKGWIDSMQFFIDGKYWK